MCWGSAPLCFVFPWSWGYSSLWADALETKLWPSPLLPAKPSLQPPFLFLISSSLVILILQKISAVSIFIAVELLEIGLLGWGACIFKALDMWQPTDSYRELPHSPWSTVAGQGQKRRANSRVSNLFFFNYGKMYPIQTHFSSEGTARSIAHIHTAVQHYQLQNVW